MRRQHFRQFIFISLLSLCLANIVNAKSPDKPAGKNEIEQALTTVGTGTAEEMKSRLFTYSITVLNAEFRAQAINALPAELRGQRITQGNLLRRVEQGFQQVLQLHRRSGKVELFLFHDEIPTVKLWHGCVLMISDYLANPMFDGELAGVIAHELGHSYFEDDMVAAQRSQNTRTMRLVELKCDAVAIVSLKLLGHNPRLYLQALQRIQAFNKARGLSDSITQSHPEFVVRAQFSDRLIKSWG